MSGGRACRCEQRAKPLADRMWRLTAWKENFSAFNGYCQQRSNYSELICLTCGARWRTRSDAISGLPFATALESISLPELLSGE